MQVIDPELLAEFEQEVTKKTDLTPIRSSSVKYSTHKPFWDKFLIEQFPEGQINHTLEKNFAIWCYLNGADLKQIEDKYNAQGWSPKALLGWIKAISEGKFQEYNPGEVYLWCVNNKRLDLADLIVDKMQPVQVSDEIKLLSDSELANYQAKTVNWIVEPFIKSGGITIIGGKRATLKSWLQLSQCYCVANGLEFLGKFKTSKGAVLYLDRENQFAELKTRASMIKKGLEVTNSDVYFISESYLKIDSPKDIERLESIIKEKKITLMICDVYRRLISFDENDAREVSKLFVDLLKPLTERTGVSIVLIHHEKKGESSGDDMDMLRGSSDLANYVDGIVQLERKGNLLTVKQNKNRAGKELEPFQIDFSTDETSFFKFEYKGAVESRENKICQIITDWIIMKKIKSFTYTECLTYVKSKGGKETNFKSALSDLHSQGVIKKGEGWRSLYYVTQDLGGFYEK